MWPEIRVLVRETILPLTRITGRTQVVFSSILPVRRRAWAGVETFCRSMRGCTEGVVSRKSASSTMECHSKKRDF